VRGFLGCVILWILTKAKLTRSSEKLSPVPSLQLQLRINNGRLNSVDEKDGDVINCILQRRVLLSIQFSDFTLRRVSSIKRSGELISLKDSVS
jgi:hypothetical protein